MPDPDKVKLSLSLPALERLLGGDTELEIQLREQIANAFARKHLKVLLNDHLFSQCQQELVRVARSVVEEYFGQPSRIFGATAQLTSELKNTIRVAAQKQVREFMDQRLQEYMDERIENFKVIVDRKLKKILDDTIKEKNLDEIVKARVLQHLDVAMRLAQCDADAKEPRVIDVDKSG